MPCCFVCLFKQSRMVRFPAQSPSRERPVSREYISLHIDCFYIVYPAGCVLPRASHSHADAHGPTLAALTPRHARPKGRSLAHVGRVGPMHRRAGTAAVAARPPRRRPSESASPVATTRERLSGVRVATTPGQGLRTERFTNLVALVGPLFP